MIDLYYFLYKSTWVGHLSLVDVNVCAHRSAQFQNNINLDDLDA